jgi:hypothetical protein
VFPSGNLSEHEPTALFIDNRAATSALKGHSARGGSAGAANSALFKQLASA